MRTRGSLIKTSMDDLTERIKIVYQTPTINSRGNVTRSTDVQRCEVWAKVLPLSSRNNLGGTERESEVTYRIVIRYRTDVLPNDEVLWRGKRLTIQNPPYDAESGKVWTVLECRENRAYGEA